MVVDLSQNIAVASDPYSLSQDVASAVRLFQKELWFDTTQGVPFFDQIIGQLPPVSLINAKLVAAAMTVPGVASAQCFIVALSARGVSGQIQVETTVGQTVRTVF